jgi:hypothetical protein
MIKLKLVKASLLTIAIGSQAFATGTTWIPDVTIDPTTQSMAAYTTSLKAMNNNIIYSYDGGAADNVVPVGTIAMWGTVTVPDGWIELDGQEITSTEYPELYLLYGTNIPDLRGYFPRAEGINANGVYAGGALLDKLSFRTALPTTTFVTTTDGAHTHKVDGTKSGTGSGLSAVGDGDASDYYTDSSGDHDHTIYGGDSETRPETAILKFIIKAG